MTDIAITDTFDAEIETGTSNTIIVSGEIIPDYNTLLSSVEYNILLNETNYNILCT
jgi:hypothetical protein